MDENTSNTIMVGGVILVAIGITVAVAVTSIRGDAGRAKALADCVASTQKPAECAAAVRGF